MCHADAGPRYMIGAGCEVPRDTPDVNLHALVEEMGQMVGSR